MISPELSLIVVAALFVIFVLAEMPVAFALAAAGSIGLLIAVSSAEALGVLGEEPYRATASMSLTLIPMFILLGMLVLHSGIAEDLFGLASRMTKRFRSGIGLATVGACTGFAAVTGSSAATAATIGKIAIPQMRSAGYSKRLASGAVAYGGTLGILIPPSIALVVYGVLAEVSIGALLLAGIIPGLMCAAIYGVLIVMLVRIEARRGAGANTREVETAAVRAAGGSVGEQPWEPHVAGIDTDSENAADKARWSSLASILILFGVIMGGVYFGWYTTTEAGAVGAVVAILLAVVNARARGLSTKRVLFDSVKETASLSSMIFALMIGGAVLAVFMIRSRIPFDFTQFLIDQELHGYVFVICVLLALIPMGMFLDPISIMLIVVPITAPAISAYGLDGVWFGILVVKLIEMALVTPPVGINSFVVAGTSKELRIEDVFRGVIPFIVVDIVVVIPLLMLFPGIVTYLPTAAGLM